MVFLSYPKYYRDAEEKLSLVETDLVESTDPEWDYEVSKGIWQLKVKTDGTFQAQHEGDIFTYRFQNLGIGQGSEFRSVDLGEPDFSNFQIIADTIRWNEVLPDIDLTVRYIHDILKVDVIVKREFMNDLRAEVNSGGLNPEDFLTARFDIPSVFINSQAKQGGEDRDIYAEPIKFTNAPLTFERDGKTLHKLRPVESYVLEEGGEPMYLDASNEPINIRSSQRWQLQRNGGGYAEMSANLGDIANAPEGDVVIDPSTSFEGEAFYGTGDIYDAYMDEGNPNTKYGSYHYLKLGNTNGSEKRILFGFINVNSKIPNNSIIINANLKLNVQIAPSNPGTIMAAAFKNIESWYMPDVTWNSNGYATSWNGGEYTNEFQSPSLTLPSTLDEIVFDIKDAFISHYDSSPYEIGSKGFLIKAIDSTSDTWQFYSTENFYTAERPVLEVDYATYTPGSLETIELGVQTWGDRIDGRLSGAYFNNRWHYYFVSAEENTHISSSFVLAPGGTYGKSKGLAAPSSYINNWLVRDSGGGTPSFSNSTPVSNPLIALQAYAKQWVEITPDLDKDWYSRMAAIFSNWIDTGPTFKVHAFLHCEDQHVGCLSGHVSEGSADGGSYGLNYNTDDGTPDGDFDSWGGIAPNFSRIGYAQSSDGYNFSVVNGNASDSFNPGPLIECWMDEDEWVGEADSWSVPTEWTTHTQNDNWQEEYNPNKLVVAGCRHPHVIERDGYLYLFYDRIISREYYNNQIVGSSSSSGEAKSIKLPNGTHVRWFSSVCVARADITNFQNYNGTTDDSPWYKYYDGQWSTTSSRKGVGGYSSPIAVSPYYFTNPSLEMPYVSYSKEINKYILLAVGIRNSNPDGRRSYLYVENDSSLPFTDWGAGMRLDEIYSDTGSGDAEPESVFYPTLVSNNSGDYGKTLVSTQNNYFYYLDSDENTDIEDTCKRFSFTIQE